MDESLNGAFHSATSYTTLDVNIDIVNYFSRRILVSREQLQNQLPLPKAASLKFGLTESREHRLNRFP